MICESKVVTEEVATSSDGLAFGIVELINEEQELMELSIVTQVIVDYYANPKVLLKAFNMLDNTT